jgi:hypothetical protein
MPPIADVIKIPLLKNNASYTTNLKKVVLCKPENSEP